METRLFSKRILFSVMLALAVLAASLPQPAQAQTTAACRTYYTVRDEDTTARIAQTYGLKWREIARANGMNPADKLQTGQRLCIPFADTDDDDGDTSSANPRATITVTVAGGRIFINSSNFSRRSVMTVKVRDVNTGVGGWYKVGTLRIGRNEQLNSVYALPSGLSGIPRVNVCLKDMTTDELICRNAVVL